MVQGVGFSHPGADHAAISGIDVRIEPGEVLLITGPSGSGKSTLAKAVAGLLPRDTPGSWTGAVWLGEKLATTAPPAEVASRVGILFQDPASQLVMERAEDDVAFGLENRAWPLTEMRARVPEALEAVGLAGFERRRSSQLSGGEQQRLALAGVEAPRPGVLVLDEPSANLDPAGAAALFGRLAALKGERSATIVLVEHRADLAWPLADRVLALRPDGTVLDSGAPGEVLERSSDALAEAGIWLPASGARARSRSRTARRPAPVAIGGTATAPAGVAPARVAMRHVRFGYEPGIAVLRDVDLEVGVGERVAIVGRNGSGKSTLLRLIGGLLRPVSGSVEVDGQDPARIPSRRLAELVGYVFQDPELGFLADTVEEEVHLGLRTGDPAGGAAQPEAAVQLLTRLGLPLDRFGGRSPYRLSGGEQRRLSVATALVRRPRLLLLDEPTFGQDRRGWEGLVAILEELVEAGTTVLFATHDEAFADRIASRRIELVDGWVVADDGPAGDPPELSRSVGP